MQNTTFRGESREGYMKQSEHLAMSHEIDIDLGCNKEAAMSEFDTFLTEMHCKLWRHSNGCIKNRYGCRLITSEVNVERARHPRSSDWNISDHYIKFCISFTICHKYDIFNGMPRKLLHHTGSSYVSRRKRLYHLPETVISPIPSNPSRALIVHFSNY